jgi:DNA-binding GntR family transcriptional regulator
MNDPDLADLEFDASSIVFTRLRDQILTGGLAPGAVLNQAALADDFGVSRMPIRQALRRLQVEGLVVRLNNRRLQVAALHRTEVEDIFDMRLVLEPLALRIAIPAATPRDLLLAERALEDAGLPENEDATFGVRNTAYHLALAAPCRRPKLLTEIRSLLELSDRYQRAAASDRPFREPLQEEHVALLDAYRRGDVEVATEILVGHVSAGRDRLLELFPGGDRNGGAPVHADGALS